MVQRVLGAISRALPRFHGPFERWLRDHPGEHEVTYRDVDGIVRTADLRDHLERGWFAGVPFGLPRSVAEAVPAGSLAIDIGANIGAVSGQLARRVTDGGSVWAIEPVPRNVARIVDMTERNGLPVDVLAVAAGAVDGTVELRLRKGASGLASVTASWVDDESLSVPLRSIDSLMDERRPPWPLSFMKIDVEGYDLEVVEGARRTLERSRPLVYAEFSDEHLRDRGSSSAELLDLYARVGYRPAPGFRDRSLDGVVVDLLLEPGVA